jgi:hypothetical protein
LVNLAINAQGKSFSDDLFRILWPKLLGITINTAINAAILGPSSGLPQSVKDALKIALEAIDNTADTLQHATVAHSMDQIIFGLLGQDIFGYDS